jgi:RHS repeat-associated protein
LGTFVYNLRFPGQFFDTETGLNYNYFRDYDAVVGRYVESDPIGLAGGINTYAYVANNPTGFSDPSGLYIGPWHRAFTETGALGAGMSPTTAERLAELVVQADVGTQGIADAHRHAMCAARSTQEHCEEKYRRFIEDELKKCTMEGLANAVHAMQDSYPFGHSGLKWYGGMIGMVFPFLGLDHLIPDAFPTRQALWVVPVATGDMIEKWQDRCDCFVQ